MDHTIKMAKGDDPYVYCSCAWSSDHIGERLLMEIGNHVLDVLDEGGKVIVRSQGSVK